MLRLTVCLLYFCCLTTIGISANPWYSELRPSAEKLSSNQVLRYNAVSDPESLDPGLITGSTEIQLVNALFEGLITYDPRDLQCRPGLATSWTISDDGLKYSFNLRQSCWSDGKAITSQDFLRSWQRVLEPKTAAPYSSQLYPILGAEDYNLGKIIDFSKVGVKAPRPDLFEITLHTPCPYFLGLCGFVTLYPVPLHIIDKFGDRWIRPEHFVGNGPFRLQAWEPRQTLTLVPNPLYYDAHLVHLQCIEAKLIDDQDTAYQLFLQGQLDWIKSIPLPKITDAMWNKAYYAMPYMGVYFYRFNTTKPPYNDARVRKALSMSIYRQAITAQVLKGGEQPASFFCPPVSNYQHIEGLAYQPQEANRLLDESGFKDRSSFPEIEIFFNSSEAHKKIAEAIAEQWKNTLGLKVVLRNSEWKVYLSEMANLNFDICRSSWIGDYDDPNTFFDLFMSKGGNNRTGWESPQYDQWLRQSQIEQRPQFRQKILQQMEKLLVKEECPIIPIYIYVNKGMISPQVGSWFENIRDVHPMKWIYMEKIK